MNLISLAAAAAVLVGQARQTVTNDPVENKPSPPTPSAVLRITVTGCPDKIIKVEEGKEFTVVFDNPVPVKPHKVLGAKFRVHADLTAKPHIVPENEEIQLFGMSHLMLICKGFSGASRSTHTAEAVHTGATPVLCRSGKPGQQAEMRITIDKLDKP